MAVGLIDPTTTDLSADDARELTVRIQAVLDQANAVADRAWPLLLEAYEHGAWVALGYGTWEAYVVTELGISRAQSYNRLDQARVARALSSAVAGSNALDPGAPPIDTTVSVREARVLKDDLAAAAAEVAQEVAAGATPQEATTAAVARRKAARHTPAGPVREPLPTPAELRRELRGVITQLSGIVEAAPPAGRGDEGLAEEFRQWVAVLAVLTGADTLAALYRMKAELFEHLLAAGEEREGLAHLAGMTEANINYWLSKRRSGELSGR